MVPAEFLAEINPRKHGEDRERDDLLDDLELERRIDGVAPAIGGNLQQVLKKAIPQLARMTTSNGRFLNFKWPYQAMVMKMFEQVSRTTGSQWDWSMRFI